MDNLSKLKNQLQWLFLAVLLTMFSAVGLLATVLVILDINIVAIIVVIVIVSIAISAFTGVALSKISVKPVQNIQQAIMHVYPEGEGALPPNLEKIRLGRELLTSMIPQIYQLASNHSGLLQNKNHVAQSANVVSHMPLPVFVFNKDQQVTMSSDMALNYIGLDSAKVYGKPLYDSLKLEFSSPLTLDSWIQDVQESKAIANTSWERVKVVLPDESTRMCDVSAYYNRDNPSGIEFIVALFDKTSTYEREVDDMSFLALAVHELRTPLTIMRGYVEVFEDELGPKLEGEMYDFMQRLQVSTNHLSDYISSILNVARIDKNQMILSLHEEDWTNLLSTLVQDSVLKAKVNDIEIRLEIADGLPTVAVDKVTIYEVITNLLDNAIKYSDGGSSITVRSSIGDDNLVHTMIEDHGPGIPENIMSHLFEKFTRSHKTREKASGTGLGLFLVKSVVNAHGGQVWVESKEGEGSTFGFSLIPYDQVTEDLKEGNGEITRHAHGWIKNHTLYRR